MACLFVPKEVKALVQKCCTGDWAVTRTAEQVKQHRKEVKKHIVNWQFDWSDAAVQAKIERWSNSTTAAETFQHGDRFSQSELSLYANITEYYDILTTGLVPHGNSNSLDGKVRGKLCTRHLS